MVHEAEAANLRLQASVNTLKQELIGQGKFEAKLDKKVQSMDFDNAILQSTLNDLGRKESALQERKETLLLEAVGREEHYALSRKALLQKALNHLERANAELQKRKAIFLRKKHQRLANLKLAVNASEVGNKELNQNRSELLHAQAAVLSDLSKRKHDTKAKESRLNDLEGHKAHLTHSIKQESSNIKNLTEEVDLLVARSRNVNPTLNNSSLFT